MGSTWLANGQALDDLAMTVLPITVARVDYHNTTDRAALCHMLNVYAEDPMGGGAAIAVQPLERLCDDLAARAFAFSFLAWRGADAVGLANCFEAYSTFKAQPLVNIHDIAVHPSARGQGVGQALLQAVEQEAKVRGACKITLEVLTGNAVALKSYHRFGFAAYALDPAAGQAVFLQKWMNDTAHSKH
jgi:ribosomal protein S18 acetylase RimI-like enzyme